MQRNFVNALKHVLVHEGGYVDHPRDPGGATNKGVTLAVFQRFYGQDKTKDDLKGITDAQLEEIYKAGYWDKCRCDDLPNGVDYVVFDQAVNSGPGRSAKWLQRAVGATADGGIGAQTLAATQSVAAEQAINRMCDARLAFLKNLSIWDTFGRGWQRRVDGVRAYGLQLASGAAAAPSSALAALAADAEAPQPSVDYDTVRRGSRGDWVERLQTALVQEGRTLQVDGIFGPATEAALKAHQAAEGLNPDGIAGKKTYQSLGLIA